RPREAVAPRHWRQSTDRGSGGSRSTIPALRQWQVLLPDRIDVGHDAVGAGEHEARGERPALEVHAGLVGRAVTLAGVTRLAAGDDVLPGCGPAAAARQDVVEGEVE